MEKEYRIRIIYSIILTVVTILGISCYLIIKKDTNDNVIKPSNKIPLITENYITASLNEYSVYDSRIIVDDESKEIRLYSNEEGISHYIIGKIGAIFNNPIVINEDTSNLNNYKNYSIQIDDKTEKYYYINSFSKTISDLYDNITPICFQNNCDYFLLNDNNNYYLLNINTSEIINLDYKIIIDNANNQVKSDKYLIVSDDDKYGIIDYNGNLIVDLEYDYISQYITTDTFIVKKGKYFGIINYKNEIKNKLEYDNIFYESDLNSYSIFIKNNKIGVYYNNKPIVNFTIDYSINDIYDYYLINNNLYLNIHSQKNNKLFIITEKGIQRFIDGKYNVIMNNDDNIKYFYSINEKDDKLDLTIYDLDLYEYYNQSLEYKKQYDYTTYIEQINNTNNYQLIISYDLDNNSEDQIYYIDLFNSKSITEIDALYTYFENGYAFTLNANGILNIYKNKELLNTYHDVYKYLGSYYFLNLKYNTKTHKTTSIIYKLDFKKESNKK